MGRLASARADRSRPSGLKPKGAAVAAPGQRHAAAVAAGVRATGAVVHRVLDLVERDLDLVEPELVALVDVEGAGQGRGQQRGGPCPPTTESRSVATPNRLRLNAKDVSARP